MLNVLGKPSSWYSRECHLKQSSTMAKGAQACVVPFPPTTMDVSMLQKQGRNLLKDASKAQIGSEVAYTSTADGTCFFFFLIFNVRFLSSVNQGRAFMWNFVGLLSYFILSHYTSKTCFSSNIPPPKKVSLLSTIFVLVATCYES